MVAFPKTFLKSVGKSSKQQKARAAKSRQSPRPSSGELITVRSPHIEVNIRASFTVPADASASRSNDDRI